MNNNDDEDYPEYECACGHTDYWCELCGYHYHLCPLEVHYSDALSNLDDFLDQCSD